MRRVLLAILVAAAAAAPSLGAIAPPREGILHGAFADFSPEEDVVTGARVRAFDELARKPIAWASFSDNWFDGIRFPAASVNAIWSVRRTIPLVRMMPRSTWREGRPDRRYTLSAIGSGAFDAQLRRYARAVRANRVPIIIDFAPEMNGNWFPWSGVTNGGGMVGPARYRTAYRRVVGIFRREGAKNVTWAFHVNADSTPVASWNRMAAYYPGDDVVDWIGVSAYGAQDPSEDEPSFVSVMDPAYRELSAISSKKPLAVFEFGTVAVPGRSQAAWIRDALAAVAARRYPRIRAISYWHSNWTNDNGSVSRMRIDSSPATLGAYRAGIAVPVFVTR